MIIFHFFLSLYLYNKETIEINNIQKSISFFFFIHFLFCMNEDKNVYLTQAKAIILTTLLFYVVFFFSYLKKSFYSS